MPGVPSGRGCDACRKQKKKCDQKQPSCGRCNRLRIECIGSGQRRFKFAEPSKFQSDSSSSSQSPQSGQSLSVTKSNRQGFVSFVPSNADSALASAFAEAIKPGTDYRFNLMSTFGPFLRFIPSRIGVNAALDSSVAALMEAHSFLCTRSVATPRALVKYSHALMALRMALDDRQVACTTETLCATMILSMCQSFLGHSSEYSSGHGVGMAQIFKYRGRFYDPNDAFESELVATLRGPVVFEAIFSDQIEFTESQWHGLVSNHLDVPTSRPNARLMHCLSRVPLFLTRGKRWRRDPDADPALVHDVTTTYETTQVARLDLRGKFEETSQKILDGSTEADLIAKQFTLVRLYAFCSAITIVVGCVLSGVNPWYAELQLELDACAVEILSLAQVIAPYRPLGGSIIPPCLAIAWIGTDDDKLKSQILKKIKEFQWNPDDGDVSIEALEYTKKRWTLRSEDSDEMCEL